jgi:hypothetical protein
VKQLTPAVSAGEYTAHTTTASDEENMSNNMLFNIAVVLVLGLGAALIAALVV